MRENLRESSTQLPMNTSSTQSDFGAITDFTETCGMNRPRVAEVPVGAYDSTRGYVNTAYTMMYFPHDGGTPKANVTPFTTMLKV